MPIVELNRCNGIIEIAIRKLKRLCDRTGEQKRFRELSEGHTKKTEKNRRSKASAVKRQKKQDQKELTQQESMRKMRKRRVIKKVTDTADAS